MNDHLVTVGLTAPRGAAAFLVLALLIHGAAAAQGPTFETLAPGVTAALQPRENWVNDSNAVLVTVGDGVLVVDAPADPQTVRRTIEKIDRLEAGPVRFLVNTHWHSDHTQGSHLYRERYGEELIVVGHETLQTDVPERAGAYIEEQSARLVEIIPKAEKQLALGLSLGGEALDAEQQAQQRLGIDRAKEQLAAYEQVELEAPGLTYDTRLTLRLGGREIRLLHFKAHTEGDTVLYLPAEKLLLTGDLLDVLPYAGHGYLESWIGALDQLATLDVERIVPGHGPVFQGKGQLRLLRDYFHAIVEGTRAAIDRGDSVEEAQASIDLARFRATLAGEDETLQRNFDAFAPETIARAYAELTGADPN